MAPAMLAKMLAPLTVLKLHLEAMAADNRAESNPVRDIAVGFILMAIALLIALVILPIVASSVATAQADTNITGANDTLLGLIPTLLIVALVLGAVGFLFRGFRGLKNA